jgi:hypothetical protein
MLHAVGRGASVAVVGLPMDGVVGGDTFAGDLWVGHVTLKASGLVRLEQGREAVVLTGPFDTIVVAGRR